LVNPIQMQSSHIIDHVHHCILGRHRRTGCARWWQRSAKVSQFLCVLGRCFCSSDKKMYIWPNINRYIYRIYVYYIYIYTSIIICIYINMMGSGTCPYMILEFLHASMNCMCTPSSCWLGICRSRWGRKLPRSNLFRRLSSMIGIGQKEFPSGSSNVPCMHDAM